MCLSRETVYSKPTTSIHHLGGDSREKRLTQFFHARQIAKAIADAADDFDQHGMRAEFFSQRADTDVEGAFEEE